MTLPPDVTALLEQLAIKLGVVAEHLWGVIVRQQVVEGVLALAACLVIGVAFCVLYRLIAWGVRLSRTTDQPGDWAWVIPAGMAVLFLAGWLTHFTQTAVTCLVNPEFAALNYLLRMVGR